MRNRLKVLALAAFAVLAVHVATAAGADAEGAASPPAADAGSAPRRDGPGRQALAACRADIQTLCGAAEAGGGRKIACLAQNRDKLSPACTAAIGTILAKAGAAQAQGQAAAPSPRAGAGSFGQVCRGDIARLCAGVEKGQGRIVKCLQENSPKVSPPCLNFIATRTAERKAARLEVKAQCAGDAATECGAGVKGPALVACLRQVQGKLAAGCQQALAKLR